MHLEPTDAGVSVVDSLDDKQGTVAVGDFTSKKRYAFVYLTCSGPGEIDLNVKPLGTYQLECDQTGVGSLNRFEVGAEKDYSVAVESRLGQTWAVTVAESNNAD